MKKYFDKLKREWVVWFYTRGIFISSIRNIRRSLRLFDIREKKKIYDLTDMD